MFRDGAIVDEHLDQHPAEDRGARFRLEYSLVRSETILTTLISGISCSLMAPSRTDRICSRV